MEEFHKVRRLPPYVFEEVNRLKAAARAGGVVQGISAGQTQIIATWRNARATARVTVTGRSSKKPDLPACPRVEASGRSLVIPTDGAEC